MENVETVETPDDDLRGMIESSFDEVKEVAPEPAAETVADVTPRDDGRDEKGRFAKKAEEPKAETQEAVAKDSGETEIKTEKAPAEQALNPPAHWSGSSKVRWEKLPVRVQEAILKDYEGIAEKDRKYSAFEQVIAPRRQALSMRYGDEFNGIKTLLAYADALDRDPAGTLQYIARERGIDLSQFASQGQQAQQFADPNMAELYRQNQILQRQMAQLTQQAQQGSTQSLQNQIDEFARNPKFPYFNDVRVQMGALIHAAHQKGQQLTMEQAYDMAVYADPTIRAEIIEAQRQQEQAEKLKKVQEAKAAVTPRGVPGGGGSVSQVKANTVRDALEGAFAAYS